MYSTDLKFDAGQSNMQNLVRMKMQMAADEQRRQQRDYAAQSQQRELANFNAQNALNDARMGRSEARGFGVTMANGRLGFANGGAIGMEQQHGKKKGPYRSVFLADGGDVTDVAAKPEVPVRVSNGEFEFTPEQVANIGAAVLNAVNGGGAMVPQQSSARGFAPAG